MALAARDDAMCQGFHDLASCVRSLRSQNAGNPQLPGTFSDEVLRMYREKKTGGFEDAKPSAAQILQREFPDGKAPKPLRELTGRGLPPTLGELLS